MGDTYAVRSDVEHLHENKHLEVFDCNARLDLVKKLEMMEYIVRSALVRILLDRNLWPHFANTTALQTFWALGEKRAARSCGATSSIRTMHSPTSTRAIFPTVN